MPNKNKYNRNVTSTNPLAPNVTLPGDSGVFGANPQPGFREYPESPTKTLPPIKFAETDFSASKGTKVNKMHTDRKTPNIAEEMGLQKPGTTKILKGRNRYQTEVKSKVTGD